MAGLRFRRSSSVKPSRPGSFTSRVIASGWYWFASARPVSPRVATITLNPFSRPICNMMRANDRSSSTTSRTRSSSPMSDRSSSIGRATIGSGSASVAGVPTASENEVECVGVQPLASRADPSLAPTGTWRSPPRRRAISREIDSPSPVPPYLRLVVPSACRNGSKISCCLSRAMPMPVSATEKPTTPPPRNASFMKRVPGLARCTRRVTDPRAVNLRAFASRFLRTCCNRCGSVWMCVGRSTSTSVLNVRSFCSASGRNDRSTKSERSDSATSRGSTGILPASTFDKSRISLISVSRSPPDA